MSLSRPRRTRAAWSRGSAPGERPDPMAARRLLGQVLKELKLVHEGMIQEALGVQKEKGGLIGRILVGLGHVAPKDLARALASQAGLPFVELGSAIPPDVLKRIDAATARVYG